ncbi:polysaccharide biosynthesis/export family protein [Desulfovibrio ferrophilus]|uniref:Sugar transporter n=1 Tax=Desulfovibrio ferrophilus TaxID=241368 RepID=A0A2Z6B1C8_9BACT|nr:polysaccharide biosynthesis/export family protein [Desulfovibrio ferrophilus]BBD09258.1 sugar transporter [Desulfovibrio ferrophilus]
MTRRTTTPLLTALVLCMLGMLLGCGPHPNLKRGEEVAFESTTFSFDKESYPSHDGLFPEYHVVPGDLLDVLFQVQSGGQETAFRLAVDHTVSVKFIHLPELNETQNVKPDGMLSLPYIGEVHVEGMTPTELTIELKKRYAKVFRDPELYVTVPEFSTKIKELKKDLHTATRGLSRLVTVRPDGYATFPLLGDVFVAGRTITEANNALDNKYMEILPGLQVDLFLEKTVGSVIYVTGQVDRPGSYMIEKPISVLQGIVMAGGSTNEAELGSVVIFRRNKKEFIATRVDMDDVMSADGNAPFFYLRPDDIVFVPRTRIASLAQLMGEISEVFLFKGWNVDGKLFDDYVFRWNNSTSRN